MSLARTPPCHRRRRTSRRGSGWSTVTTHAQQVRSRPSQHSGGASSPSAWVLTFLYASGEGGDRDCTILIATDRDDEEDLALLEAARGNGHLVIAIGQDNSEAVRRGCDRFLSNRCSEPDGVLPIPGSGTAICPATGIINNIVMQSLLGEMISAMCARGVCPYFVMGVFRTGAQEYNDATRPNAEARGY